MHFIRPARNNRRKTLLHRLRRTLKHAPKRMHRNRSRWKALAREAATACPIHLPPRACSQIQLRRGGRLST